jgi:hypothetical protein
LPACGYALRCAYKTLAYDSGVPDDLSAFLLGHIPEGMSPKYAVRRHMIAGRALRKHQAAISHRMLELLGAYPTLESPLD